MGWDHEAITYEQYDEYIKLKNIFQQFKKVLTRKKMVEVPQYWILDLEKNRILPFKEFLKEIGFYD